MTTISKESPMSERIPASFRLLPSPVGVNNYACIQCGATISVGVPGTPEFDYRMQHLEWHDWMDPFLIHVDRS